MKLSEELGFTENKKLLIIHADDAGLCHSENQATIQSLREGAVNSYSIMVPCPWFFEIAGFARSHPEFDYGVHLTLTCEWETYRFGPVLPVTEVPSLVDDHGFFYKKREKLRENAVMEEVEKELRAQIERAFSFGLTPSHLDSHMYSVGARDDLFAIYRKLGREFKLPVLLNQRMMEEVGMKSLGTIKPYERLVDKVFLGEFKYFEKSELQDYYRSIFENLVYGLNVVLIHPAFNDREMQGVTVNHPNFGAEWRQIDFNFFTSDECKSLLAAEDIELVTWNDIKSVIRKEQNKKEA